MTPEAGYTPDDQKRGVPLFTIDDIAAIFANAPADKVREIAESLAQFTYASLNARIQGDVRDDRKVRILSAGADVKNTGAGTQVKYPGESYADVLNFTGPVSVESSTFGRRFNVTTGGGGADCMFDAIISTCWATEVAAGRGTEGQTMTSLTGCPFKVYSTVQGAFNGIPATTKWVMFLCSGTYAEDVVLNNNSTIVPDLIGAGKYSTFVRSFDIQDTSGAGSNDKSSWRDFTIKGNGTLVFTNTLGTQLRVLWERIDLGVFSGAGTGGTVLLNNPEVMTLRDCRVHGGVTSFATQTADRVWFDTCYFEADVSITGSNAGTVAITDCWLENSIVDVRTADGFIFTGNRFDNASGSVAAFLTLNLISANYSAIISENIFAGGIVPTTAFIFIDSLTSAARNGLVVTNNYFSGGTYSASTRVLLSDNANVIRVLFANNVITPDTSGDFIEDLGGFSVSGNFNESTFGPNVAAHKVEYSITGTDNLFIPSSSGGGTGVGSNIIHDADGDTYVDTERTADSDIIESASGGTIRSRLSALGLELANGTDLLMYSDAFTVLKAAIDGATGHAGLGGSGEVSATTAVQVGDFYTDPASLAAGAGIGDVTIIAHTAGSVSRTHVGTYLAPGIYMDTGTLSGEQTALLSGWVQSGGGTMTQLTAWKPLIAVSAGIVNTARAIHIPNISGSVGVVDAFYAIDIDALTYATANYGIRSLAKVRWGAASEFDGIAAPATPAADDIVVYNETATDLLKAKDDNGAVYALTHKHLVPWALDAMVTTQKMPGPKMPHAGVITNIFLKTADGVTIGATALVLTIYKVLAANVNTDGGTAEIFTTRPTITNGNMRQDYGPPDLTTTFAAGDVFVASVTAVGTNATFVSLTMEVRYV